MDNLIVSAPNGSGKTIAMLLLSLRPFINEEQGTLVFLCHSKDLSQSLRYLLSQTTSIKVINLWMGEKY
jgi:superfamily II DNA/RNA helicase